jgi:predicted transglutaminase-like cysteine proteinase
MSWNRRTTLRNAKILPRLLLGASLATCLAPTSALAISLPGSLAASTSSPFACSSRSVEPAAAIVENHGGVTAKSEAILGGQPSALDLIRQQQAGLDAPADRVFAPLGVAHTAIATPGACLVSIAAINPLAATPIAASTSAPIVAPTAVENFLGSARVGIRRTPFNDDWQRVSAPQLTASRVDALIGTGTDTGVATLSRVNRWANGSIGFADDSDSYGRRDYWATAEETLAAGRGDCEDYAILKYQMLAALGFDRSRMYLTLARDLVRNVDHAVLVVRIGDAHYMLDNATDTVLLADVPHDYRPTMSFNSERAWLHGATDQRRSAPAIQPRAFAYLSDSAVSSARVTGLSR